MSKINQFLRQHALWVTLVAVAIPLTVHLSLQYKSLSTLELTIPEKRRAHMRRYLYLLHDKIKAFYEDKANEVLNVPATAFHHKVPNPGFRYEDAFDLKQVEEHFATHQFKGARLLFVGNAAGPHDPHYAIISYYDPISCAKYQPTAAEFQAAHGAAANWIVMIMSEAPPNPRLIRLTVDERDSQNRIIVKPIVDDKSRVVGVAGMFLDKRVFFEDYLAAAIKETEQGWFPDEYEDLVVTVLNNDDELLYASQPFEGKAYEVAEMFPFIFSDHYLGIRMRNMTEAQRSRWYFLSSLSFSILTALVLIGGIILALRTASRAMKLSQMKADFVSNVSHELRTPLASIRIFGEFLKLGRIKEPLKVHEYGEYIENESRRLTQLINNILDFSRIESGLKTYQFEEAEVEPVVADTIKTFDLILEQNGFTIDFDKPEKQLPPVVMDANAISQALINLLDNAVKYSGAAKEIGVRLGQENGIVTIAVSDRGIGIDKEDLGKVFEKFYRVGNCLVHDVKGSGLGLSIVKHIVEAHCGCVTVESEPGKGSTFTIRLPVKGNAEDLNRVGGLLDQELSMGGQPGD
ncbi:MAG: HAMP domain-containing histidine kinase [Blastocatellia bacterium]|nr:HAMP domain-containing histidine kinase [Blastocatellia bacterium]